MKTFLQLYNECTNGAVLGPAPDSGSADSQFSGDEIYAPGDARRPTTIMPMISRFETVSKGRKRKKKSIKGKK